MATPSHSRILSGPVALETLRFGLPLAVGMGLQTAFNLVDAYIVSRLPYGARPNAPRWIQGGAKLEF